MNEVTGVESRGRIPRHANCTATSDAGSGVTTAVEGPTYIGCVFADNQRHLDPNAIFVLRYWNGDI
jgi:hypothetical protein